MNKTSTPNLKTEAGKIDHSNRESEISCGPRKSTLDFIRMFARTYVAFPEAGKCMPGVVLN